MLWDKKTLLLFFLSVIFSSHIFSQVLYWQKLCDFDYVFDVKINSSGDIFICSQNVDGVIRSTDDGVNWEILNLPNSFRKLEINEANEIFAATNLAGGIFKSTDNGDTWTNVYSPLGAYRSFIINSEGYIFGGNINGLLMKSFDDGLSWSIDTVTNVSINTIVSCNNGEIFLGTEGKGIFKSTDYGTTWERIINQNISNYVRSMTVNDSDYLLATNYDGISISTDYGTEWSYRNTITSTSLGELALDSVGNIFLGNAGLFDNRLYKSEDFGFTWNYLGKSSTIYKILIIKNKIFLATSDGLYSFDPNTGPYIGENYLPLHAGNRWQFLDFQDNTGLYSYSLYEINITRDSLINANQYFLWGNKWIRYCDSTKLITIWDNESEKLYMNFNLPEDSVFTQFDGYIYRDVVIKERDNNIFLSKGFYFDTVTTGNNWEIKTFAENIGFYYLENGWHAITHFYSVSTCDLMMAILYDSLGNQILFTGHYKPLFILDPILSINQSNFELSFKVDHYYSHFFDPGVPFNGLNFIDSVLMYRYYANRDSIINLDPIIPYNDITNGQSPNYSVDFELDTTLMKNGFNFYYRFYAKDKGIIPECSYSPYSGYYECVWEFPSAISENEKSFSYTLEQNFPNPFNPNTTIAYTISKSGRVILDIFDVLGRKLKTLVNEFENRGSHTINFDASEYSSGIYFYTLKSGEFVQTRKMILLR